MKATQNSIIEICPIRNVVARFGDKWSLLVLLVINSNGTVRFNELADALIDRKVYAQVPPKVEYSLTDTGRSLIPLIMQLTEWAQQNMAKIMTHRRQHASARQN